MWMNSFAERHIGPRSTELPEMLSAIGVKSLDELIGKTIPDSIRSTHPLNIESGISEADYFERIREISRRNKIFKSYIGQGYYNSFMPAVIQRNILENPSWYTSYTPYQAEISQGRLEALLNFQTVVIELTRMEIANASLLDEATAAAEAMIMFYNARSKEAVKNNANIFLVDENIFSQTIEVIKTRAVPLEIEIHIGPHAAFSYNSKVFGAIVQYPGANGAITDYSELIHKAHTANCPVAVAADLLSLCLLTPPGEWGADVVVGSTQRFGIPMGYGGPHAAFFATREQFKRHMPGRIIGVSVDKHGNKALRMALQTREQHIKRERATSNICTAQALLASMAGMYALYHGAEGLINMASKINSLAKTLADKLTELGFKQNNKDFFDTLLISLPSGISRDRIMELALEREINLNYNQDNFIGISLDETTSLQDVNQLLEVFTVAASARYASISSLSIEAGFKESFKRKSHFLSHDVFNRYRSETEMMRYIKKLERKDFSLTHCMISLGSCTMKLNAAMEMLPLSWPEFGNIHPFAPIDQTEGYQLLFYELAKDLEEITGLQAISFQPNSGAAGEYTGLLVIREYHLSRGESNRNVVLIPSSAHGTNPASAAMAGMQIVVVNCDTKGNIDINDLKLKAESHKANLAAFMVTYPSTHGVFESRIKDMAKIIHDCGGLVYMDGANMNAKVGLTNPAIIGADVCHLNLHKTFAIPHGGGGPGMGPIAVASHLVEFLPGHPVIPTGGSRGITSVASAPWGSASILTISHAYIKMLGAEGLELCSKIAIVNANYLAARLNAYFPVLYTGETGFVGHEMILDCRGFKQDSEIIETDIAKRLMDYGFHAPTLSFPVHGTLMIEPTESESKQELDKFIDSLLSIYSEIMEVKNGTADKTDNVLKNSPHTALEVTSDNWNHHYGRHKAAYPLSWVEENKFWPSVARIDDAFGDRNLVCTCIPIEEYKENVQP
jgi:glycine dehydrogenase